MSLLLAKTGRNEKFLAYMYVHVCHAQVWRNVLVLFIIKALFVVSVKHIIVRRKREYKDTQRGRVKEVADLAVVQGRGEVSKQDDSDAEERHGVYAASQ